MLLLLHLSHYLRSLGAYGRAGHDFIRSMLFLGFSSMVCLCVWRPGSCCSFAFLFYVFFSVAVIHTTCILHFLLAHLATWPLLTHLNKFQ